MIDANGRVRSRISDSIVRFKRLSPVEIDAYVASGEPMGRAGAYAIQGGAERFVRRLSGSYSAVMGLPLHETATLLRRELAATRVPAAGDAPPR